MHNRSTSPTKEVTAKRIPGLGNAARTVLTQRIHVATLSAQTFNLAGPGFCVPCLNRKPEWGRDIPPAPPAHHRFTPHAVPSTAWTGASRGAAPLITWAGPTHAFAVRPESRTSARPPSDLGFLYADSLVQVPGELRRPAAAVGPGRYCWARPRLGCGASAILVPIPTRLR